MRTDNSVLMVNSKINRITMSGILAVSGILSVVAAPLTPEEALDRAMSQSAERIKGTTSAAFRLARTISHDNEAAIYLYESRSGGWMAVSADDVATPVIGYGDGKVESLNGESAPGFEYWMSTMARRIADASKTEKTSIPSVIMPARPVRKAIEPMCATRWNQNDPYNAKCPEQNGQTTYTGCVATAMAQVMRYHNWPDEGVGSNSYTWNGKKLSISFSKIKYEWDQMLDDYAAVEEYDLYQKRAIATLMQACGYSVNMNYSIHGSGAYSINIAPALVDYFKYNKGMRYEQREYYQLNEWETLLYDNLTNCGPVIYNGQSEDGGHSFVCDGYSADGYFHFNWGWGGLSDGYFLLDSLDPINQGIGGSTTAFNFMQDFISGIKPDKTGDSVASPFLVLYSGLSVRTFGVPLGEEFPVYGYLYNPGPTYIEKANVGFRLTPVGGGEPRYVQGILEGIGVQMGINSIDVVLPEDMEDGVYDMVSVYYIDGYDKDWVVTPTPVNDVLGIRVTIEDGIADFEPIEPAMPEIAELTWPVEFGNSEEIAIGGRIENNDETDLYAILSAILVNDKNQLVGVGRDIVVDLTPGETMPLDYTTTFADWDGKTVKPGNYYLCVAAQTATQFIPLTEMCEVTVTESAGIENVLYGDEKYSDSPIYFDMFGRQISKPETGVYVKIERAGGGKRKVSKIIF